MTSVYLCHLHLQLLARIERMERRLQLTRKDPRDKRLFQPLEPWTPDKEDMWDLDVPESPQTNTPTTPLPFSRGGKGQKRYKNEAQTLCRASLICCTGNQTPKVESMLEGGERSQCLLVH